jgi:hypothetical protein
LKNTDAKRYFMIRLLLLTTQLQALFSLHNGAVFADGSSLKPAGLALSKPSSAASTTHNCFWIERFYSTDPRHLMQCSTTFSTVSSTVSCSKHM